MEKILVAAGKVQNGEIHLEIAVWPQHEIERAVLAGGRIYRAGEARSYCLNEYERVGFDEAAQTADYEEDIADRDYHARGQW